MTVSASTKADTLLGRVVVDQGFITKEELEEIRAMQTELVNDQRPRGLAELLVENGYATQRQIDRAKVAAEETSSLQQVPGYQILSKLGSGAMATVYKARQLSLDRIVAIKILPAKMTNNKDFVDRFYKEGRAAAKLNHPNIVGAYDVGEANGRHYFVMEYVEGGTVYDRLDKGERYSERESLQITIQICKALVHAHKAGFIHRDVKPKNIMITPAGVAKLADMGLARGVSDMEAAQAEAGKAYGTPYYISPEQIRGEIDIDGRADIYSLGGTFYHMITGRVPFDAPTPSAVMHKHLKEELTPPDHIVPATSAGVAEIIEVAMAKRRKNRYQSAEDMLTDLERVAAGEPPIIARKSYNLDQLAQLETAGNDAGGGGNVPVSAQATIDVSGRTIKDRLLDPIVLGLGAALLLSLVIIILLAMR